MGVARADFRAAAANFALPSEANVNTANEKRGPPLLISGMEDHTVPDLTTRSTLKQYRNSSAVTQLKQFEGRGHSLRLTVDGARSPTRPSSGWRRSPSTQSAMCA